MPAAAVIPAPIAYIKVVAVKKLVVGSRIRASGPPRGGLLLDGACVGRPSGADRRASFPVSHPLDARRCSSLQCRRWPGRLL